MGDDWRGIPEEYRNAIVTGDARVLAGRVPDESVDLIFTDPVYQNIADYQWLAETAVRVLAGRVPDESVDLIFTDPVYQNIADYQWLAETAVRVLKPDSACLCWCGIGYLPETLDALRAAGLKYRWRLVLRPLFGHGSGQWHGRLQVGTKELLWYEKGKSKLYNAIFDLLAVRHSEQAGLQVNGSTWGKSLTATRWYLSAFTRPNDIVFDPFTGGGTVPAVCKMLDRRYVAFEIDPDTAELARQRVQSTQPPLPGINEMIQPTLFEEDDE
jgi:DNA modification methylase